MLLVRHVQCVLCKHAVIFCLRSSYPKATGKSYILKKLVLCGQVGTWTLAGGKRKALLSVWGSTKEVATSSVRHLKKAIKKVSWEKNEKLEEKRVEIKTGWISSGFWGQVSKMFVKKIPVWHQFLNFLFVHRNGLLFNKVFCLFKRGPDAPWQIQRI